ncbi:MAG: hypothetical protein ACOYOB_10125 [Myxococcota bacterium]
MGRKVLAIVVGLVAWLAAQYAFELIKNLHPPTVLLQELGVHAVAVALAAALATWVGKWTTPLPAMALGGGLMLANLAYLLAVPHPMWFELLDLLLFVPAAMLGARLVMGKEAESASAV